jgi:SSS family solute:Na+ symporter
MGRIVAELNKGRMEEGSLLYLFADANFLHFAIFLFAVCVAVLVVVSLFTPAPDRAKLGGLTFATAEEPMSAREPDPVAADRPTVERAAAALHAGGPAAAVAAGSLAARPGWRRVDVALSILLAAAVGLVWLVFS